MPGLIQQIRASIDSKLDALQARAEALDAQLSMGKREADERIKRHKQALREALDHLKAELQRQRGLAEDKRRSLAAAIDELKVQIALGKADALDVLEAQRKKIAAGIARFEADFGPQLAAAQGHLSAGLESVMRRYVQASDALTAELEAAKERLKQEAANRGVDLERHKRELNARLAALKRQLAEQRKLHAHKLKQFHHDLKPGLDQIAKAFKGLFS